jgi:hypothetical protein
MGIEIWRPYVEQYRLDERYDYLITEDARIVGFPPKGAFPEADLCIFGDVLEHMPDGDAVKLWDRARDVSRWLVINLPVRRYEQGPLFGNPHEEHVHHWDTPSVLERFEGIVSHNDGEPPSVVGAFIARGLA